MTLRDYEVWKGIYSYSVSALDRKQAIQLFMDNFKDDPEIDKVKITRTQSGRLNQLGDRIYIIFFRMEEKSTDRPPCIECGSANVISRGKEWYCLDCGRYRTKKIRRHKT